VFQTTSPNGALIVFSKVIFTLFAVFSLISLPFWAAEALRTKVDEEGRAIPLGKRWLTLLITITTMPLLVGMCLSPWLSGSWRWLGIGWILLAIGVVTGYVIFSAILIFDSLFRPSSGLIANWYRKIRQDKAFRKGIADFGLDPDAPDLVEKLGDLESPGLVPDPVTSGVDKLISRLVFKRGVVALFILLANLIAITGLSTIWDAAVGIGRLGGLLIWVAILLFGVVRGFLTRERGEAWKSIGLLGATAAAVGVAWLFGLFDFLQTLFEWFR
jgi:hypothetical protein